MSLISRMRKQTAVWWSQAGVDRYGRPTYASPVAIACRWDDVAELFVSDEEERAVSKALVYVDRLVKPGDVLFKGTIAQLSDQSNLTNPHKQDATFTVRAFRTNPNLRATENLYTAVL